MRFSRRAERSSSSFQVAGPSSSLSLLSLHCVNPPSLSQIKRTPGLEKRTVRMSIPIAQLISWVSASLGSEA
ncbi:hypothetical protein GQ53DRAFT_371216 [Thozetella sp. PMI_491]|nr:hypothetical protein GQ53DRAFT_371216 [Thozetella sp. PMI_491]